MTDRIRGLVAAAHTPFDDDGELRLDAVEAQAGHLLAEGVVAAFVGGTTGESHSLTVAERLALAERWVAVARGSALRVIVHVGGNSLEDARTLAAQAQDLGAWAVAALAPSYFKPAGLDDLVACCERIASAAPGLPFFFYDIPGLTGIHLPMPAFLDRAADRIPTLAGIKFTNPDLAAYQLCLRARDGRFDIPWGTDETLLAALALGAGGAVGSTYNFAAGIARDVLNHFARGDLDAARAGQVRLVRLVQILAGFGYMAAAKATMGMLGVPVGPPRLPIARLEPGRADDLRRALESFGFFDAPAAPE